MNGLWLGLVATGLFLSGRSPSVSQEDRLPIPAETARKEANDLIRDVFKEDYGSSSTRVLKDLAGKLLEQGMQTQDNPAARFVLFMEARDVAFRSGALEVGLQAVDTLSKEFDVDSVQLKVDALSEAAKNVRTPQDAELLAKAQLALVDEALRSERYGLADQAVRAAASLARKSKMVSLVKSVRSKKEHLSDLNKLFARVEKARKILEKSPDNPEANLEVGRYMCFTRDEWEKGLVYLRKGSDKELQTLSLLEADPPTTPDAQMTLGDAWWDLSESRTESNELKKRAAHWYGKALPLVAGLTKLRAEKRLTAVAESNAPPWRQVFDGKTTLCLRDSSKPYWHVSRGFLARRPGTEPNSAQTMETFEDGSIRVRFIIGTVIRPDAQLYIRVRQGADGSYGLVWKAPPSFEPLKGKEQTLVFRCKGAQVTATLNEKPISVMPDRSPRKGCLQITPRNLDFRIRSVEFRPLNE